MSPLHRIIRQHGPHRIPLGPAKLYLDDIQDIVSAIESFKVERNKKITADSPAAAESNDSESVAIIATDRIADTVEDLREASREELKHLSISLDSADLFIYLYHINSDISVPRDDTDTRALAEDLAHFIKKKRMRSGATWFLRGSMLWLSIALVANISGCIYYIDHHKAYASSLIAAVFSFALLMSLTTFVAPSKLNEVRIIAIKRSEDRWFSRASRREILIAVVASIIGAIIIALSGLWAGFFVHH
jgi:hypothetical protein